MVYIKQFLIYIGLRKPTIGDAIDRLMLWRRIEK